MIPRNKSLDSRRTTTYIYINGLSGASRGVFERFVDWWWRIHGMSLVRYSVDWYRSVSLDTLIHDLAHHIEQLLKRHDRVVLIGSSAGGSLALSVFYIVDNPRLYFVNSRGRLIRGNYQAGDPRSLEHCAKLDTSRPSMLFYDSVLRAESYITHLTQIQKHRILTLSQLTDSVVPLETMRIPGVKHHTSLSFDHPGGLIAHMLANTRRIKRFALSQDTTR